MKQNLTFVVGAGLLIFGVSLILGWWNDVVILFKGGAGIVLALGGMLTLYLAKR